MAKRVTDAREYFKNGTSTKKKRATDAREYFATEENLKPFYESYQARLDNWAKERDAFYTETNNYYTNRDLSSYGLDRSQKWKESVTSRQSWIQSEADYLQGILDQYGHYFDSDLSSQLIKAFGETKTTNANILRQADDDINFLSQFKDEGEYQNFYFTDKYNGKSYTDVLRAIESASGAEKDWLSKNSQYFMSSGEAQSEIDKLSKYKSEKQAIATELNNLRSQLTNAYARAGYGSKVKEMVDSDSRVIKLTEQLGDYDGVGTANRIAELTEIKGQATLKEKNKALEAEAKRDKDFGSYVALGESKGLSLENKWFEPNGSGGINVFERGYADYIVGLRNGKISIAGTEEDWYAKHMTDAQYKNYVYFLGKYGEDKAAEYLDTIKYELNTKQALDIQESLNGTFLLPQIFGAYAGLSQFGDDLKGLFSDGYEAPSATQIASGLVREDQDWFGKVTYDLANTTAHMLPSILGSAVATALIGPAGLGVAGATTAGAIGQGVGAGITGLSAMGGARQEMLNLGYSKAQANTYGFLTGASEAGLQYAIGGIGKLGGAWTDDAVKALTKGINRAGAKFAIEFGADMVAEGFEEGLQEVLTPFFKNLVTGKNEGVDWGQVAYSGLLGALSAGVLNGLGAGGNRIGELSTAKKIKGNESQIAKLKEVGNTFAADTLAHKLASKVDDKTGAWKIADVIHEMRGTLTEQNKADIKEQLVRSGMVESDADTIAEWLGKAVDGDHFTATQRKALDNNPVISRVFKKVIIDQNSTVNQRLQALMDFQGTGEHAGVDYSAIAKSQSKEAISYRINYNNALEAMKTEAIKDKYSIGKDVRGRDAYNAELDSRVAEVKALMHNAKVSESGTTTDATTGKEVTIKKVKDAQAKLFELGDGSTISSKNVEYSDDDTAILYETVLSRGYDTATANAVINGLKVAEGLTATQYLNGVDEAIEYGKIGYPMDKISTDGFYADLSDSMKKFAYNLGKDMAKKETESAQAKVDGAKGKVEEARKGEVIISTKKGLTERQKVSLETLGKMVSDITHNKVYIFDTVEKVINGKKVRVLAEDVAGYKAGTIAPNGFYNKATGEIYIDLHAGENAEGTILWTAAHELTHFIKAWSPAKFKVLADFLMAEYGKQGVDIQTLIDQQILKSKRKNLTRDQAYEEVVADAMQTMFTDTNLAEKVEKLKNTDKGLWNKIKQFFRDLYKRITKHYDGLDAQTDEARLVRKMGDSIKRLSDLFAEALVDAGNTYAYADIDAVASGEVDIDGNKNSHVMSIRSMAEGAGLSFEYDTKTGQIKVLDMFNGTEVTSVTAEQIKDAPLGNIVTLARQNGFISDAEAKKQYGFLSELVNLCLNYKENFTMVWEIAGTQVFSAIKANSDTQYGKTIDFSTVCKKTQQVINVISETQKRLKRGLTKDEIKNIVYYETGKAGEPTPCPVCYVFSRWMGIGGILQQMSDFQKKYESATEEDMRSFINDVESEIIKHANTPNKSGKLKAEFFDKNGKPKFGTVIADLKAKANSKIKSANIRLKIQETETLLEKADVKDKAKLQKTLNRLKNKLAKEGDVLDARLKEAEALLSRYEEYQWLTKTYMDEVKAEDGTHLGWKLDKNFKPVDEDVLWDLREGARFATEFPKSWLYRTTKGCNAGKAILPYSDARVGETIQGVAYANVKDIMVGENNAFLNGDKKAQADYVTRAIKKQLAQNLIGGMRYQSTSDFRYEYGSDYLITFLEMQAIGAKVQLYTKVIEAVDFLCTMGAEVNLSVMPLNKGYIEYTDGRKQLVFSSVTGINAEAAIAKTKQYDNAQLILVGISDEHIRLALEGDDVNGDVVTFVIPFHGSGNTVKAIQELMDLIGEELDVEEAQDYSLVQTDHFAKNRTAEQTALWDLRKKIISRSYKKNGNTVSWDGKLTTAEEALLNSENGSKYLKDLYNRFYVDETADEYGVSLSTAQAEQIFPYEYWDKSLTYAEADRNGERFKEYCATMGIIPRFSGVDSSGKALGYGDFTNTKGYWKLLIDRKMYNNDGTYHSPGKINVSNFKAETLNPAWGSATYGDVMQKDTNPKKTNAITENVIRQIGAKESANIMFSPRGDVLSWDIAWDSDNHSSIKDQLRAHLDEVNSMQPVASVNYNKAHGKPYYEQLDEILRTKFGYKIERQDHGSITFDKDAIKGVRGYVDSDAEAAALIVAPYILKRGKAISGHKDHKGKGYPSIVYAAPATLNGEVGNVAVSVLYGGARRVHSLRVLTPSGKEFILAKIKNTEPTTSGASLKNDVEPTISSVLSGNRIAQNPNSVNTLEENSSASDFVTHMKDIVKNKGGWYARDVFRYVNEHPELNYIERIYAKDKAVKKDLEAFLNTINDTEVLENLSWFMRQAYGDKDHSWSYSEGSKYPYRGATRTFQNAVNKRINAIMTEKVGGTNLGIKNGEVSLQEVKSLFDRLNSNEEIGRLAEKVFATAEKLGVNIRFANQVLSTKKCAGDALGDMVEYKTSFFNDTAYTDQRKASTILHELIHVCTVYVLSENTTSGDVRYGSSKSTNYERIANAATRLNRIFYEIKDDPDFKGQYGIKNTKEMVAELSNENFVGLLKKKNLWDRIVDWIAELFGFSRGSTAYDNAMQCLDYILDNPEVSEYKAYAREQRSNARDNEMDVFGSTQYTDYYGNERVAYSERNSNATDNRSLLANALESVAQNDVERSWLTKYKAQIASLNEDQSKLAKIRAKIKEARFTKGADRSKLPALESQANILADRISKADKRLLMLEASKPLQGVVDRERAKAYKLGMEKLTKYRKERAESTELHYYRPRIEKIVSDLQDRLEHPTAKTAIPEIFGATIAKVLSAFDFTTYDSDGNVRPGKANVTRAEARESLKALAKQLGQNTIEGEYGQLDVPPEMVEWIEKIHEAFEATAQGQSEEYNINKMSAEELKLVYKFLKVWQKAINNVGRYYTNASYDVASDAKSTMEHVGKLPTEVNEALQKATKTLKWDLASPVTVFDRFGEGGKHVYNMLVKGQSKMAYNVQEILDFVEDAYTEKEAREWQEKLVPVKIGGEEHKVTVEMLMGLHCLLKQEDSRRHILEGGGIRFADVKEKGKVKRFENTFFNEMDEMAVEKALDAFPRAKAVAEAMQKFMEETGSSWGNEISMVRFGYHAFTTKGYYPIRTIKAGSEYEAQQKRANIYALLNKSFTKERSEMANNAVIVDGIFSVFNNHMAEMALYNAWALPVIDTIKWFNYKETQDLDAKTAEKSVHETFRLAYGSYADRYVRELLEAINSQTDSGLSEEWGFLNMRMVNRVAVSWNARVAIQQPFSITRAYELINPKYVTPLVGKAYTEAKAEMLENSGVAKWKSMGYYSVDVSRPLEVQVKKNAKAADKFSEVGMKGAEAGDTLAWTALWNACKKETAEKNPGLKGEELLAKTAERFDDLVLRTQVVDSVLVKSPWMRSKSFWHKSTSAFMSEPLTSYNALLRMTDNFSRDGAIHGVKYAVRKNGKNIVRATGVFILTQLVNALVTAPLDGLRDDDDYETYLEKVFAEFKDNAVMNLLPTSMLPYVNDIIEYMRYGRTDRADMALVVGVIDLGKSIYNLFDPDKYSYHKLHNTFNSMLKVGSQFSGFAVSNIFRDALSAYNAVAGALGYGELKFQTSGDTHSEGYKRMYEAMLDGNEARMGYLFGQMLSNGVDEDKVYNGITKLISEEVKSGDITDAEATERLKKIIEYLGKTDSDGNPITDNDIYWMIDKWHYAEENGSTEEYSKYDDIFTAMEKGDPSTAIADHVERLTEHYYTLAKAKAEENGTTLTESKAKKEAESKANSAIKSAITSYWKPKYKEAYKNKDDEEMKRIRYMLRDTKLYGSTTDLLDTVKGWLKD